MKCKLALFIIENSTLNIVLKSRNFGVSSYLTRKHQKGVDHDQHYWITLRHLSELVSISQAQYGQRILIEKSKPYMIKIPIA